MSESRLRVVLIAVAVLLGGLTAALVVLWRDVQAADARVLEMSTELEAAQAEVVELRGRVTSLEEESGVGTLGVEDVERLFQQFLEQQGLDDLPGRLEDELGGLRDRLGLPSG